MATPGHSNNNSLDASSPEPARSTSIQELDLSNSAAPALESWFDGDGKINLPFSDECMDHVVLGSEIVARVAHSDLIDEAYRVLRAGGRLSIQFDIAYDPEDNDKEIDTISDALYTSLATFSMDSFNEQHGILALDATKLAASPSIGHTNVRAIAAVVVERLHEQIRRRHELSEKLALTASELQMSEARLEAVGDRLRERDGRISEQRLLNASQARRIEELSSQVTTLKRRQSLLQSQLTDAKGRTEAAVSELGDLRVQLEQERYQTEYQRWRASSLERSKWARIAEQLVRAKRPWLVPAAIYRTVAIMFGPSRRPPMPKRATKLLTQKPTVSAHESSGLDDQIGNIAPFQIPDPKPVRNLRVATILDEFSELAFQYEFEVLPVPRTEWRQFMANQEPDLLFVESAWNANSGDWKFALTGSAAPRQDVLDLIEHCRELGIPTVFWNKEDPLEYDRFLESARHFDWVFTVDANCLPKYKAALGHERVGVLPFAVQPLIHNPIRSDGGTRQRGVAFAGTYYAGKYPERSQQMDDLLTPCLDLGLEIYSRFDNNSKYRFPDHLAGAVIGSLDYSRMLTAYREHKVFLNVNSVVDSSTMFSRRVLELLACGTPVVSGPSPGMAALLGDGVVETPSDRDETRLRVRSLLRNVQLRDRKAVEGVRSVMADNTYGDRVDHLLNTIGVKVERKAPRISVLAPTNRREGLDSIIESVGRQAYENVELIIGAHGILCDEGELKNRAESLGISHLHVVRAPEEWSLGRVLNDLARLAEGEYIAKMDDDDIYGRNYLSDQLLAFRYTNADIVGKWTRHVYLSGSRYLGVLFPGHEHRFTELVGGGTILAKREVFDAVAFADRNVGEDSQFLRECKAVGLRTYSTDRFNFVYMRHDDQSKHTFGATDLYHMANMNIVSVGDSLDGAFV